MNFSSILIPHDGSVLAGSVVRSVAPLLKAGVVVTLLHVKDRSATYEDELAKAEQEIVGYGATVSRQTVVSQDAAEAVLDAAALLRPDLLSMSTHGQSGIKRWIRGSVAERVLRECPAPILMVNPLTDPSPRFSRVLVPLDASDYSAQIMDSLIPFAQEFTAELTLLYVDFEDDTDSPEQAARRREYRKRDIEGWLAKPIQRAKASGLAAQLRIAHGDVASVIVDLTKTDEYDLVAMTTHGSAGPSRWSLGSVATNVLRSCEIPVLLHRTTEGS